MQQKQDSTRHTTKNTGKGDFCKINFIIVETMNQERKNKFQFLAIFIFISTSNNTYGQEYA